MYTFIIVPVDIGNYIYMYLLVQPPLGEATRVWNAKIE